jgi:hypothetical protein
VTRASKFFRFRTALLVAACISALSAALVSNAATHVASATSENYNCQSNWGKSTCNYVHGNDNYIKNIQGVITIKKPICAWMPPTFTQNQFVRQPSMNSGSA